MGILDDAIKEHLELKRQHGADESDLKKLEDEAFGAGPRPGDEEAPPDPYAEAPTEFLDAPGEAPAEEEAPAPEEAPVGEAAGPDSASAEPQDADAPGEPAPRASRPDIADLQEPPPPAEPAPAEPAPAESPAAPASHTTEEREQIAEQPTELFDVEEELGAAAPAPERVEEHEPPPPPGPLDEEEDLGVAPIDDEDDEFDDFWDEQRLSDELDQALEGPLGNDEFSPAPPVAADAAEAAQPTEPPLAPEPPPPAEPEAAEGDAPPEDATPLPPAPPAEPEADDEEPQPIPPSRDEDVLEGTPDFLEEAPEDDQLWFEQKPPKDFDFDD